MVLSSGRQTIVLILLLLNPFVSAQSQSAVDKAATATISGKITAGGKGVSGVVVGLVTGERSSSTLRPTRFRSITDEGGNYRITNVPPDTYEVIPASPAYVATEGRKSLVVSKNETIENVDIALQLGGVITGKLTDADGRPVIEELVYVYPAPSQQRVYFREVRTDDRGVYRAYGVPAGRYTVSAGRGSISSLGSRQPESYQLTYHPSATDPAAAKVINVSEGSEATNVDITFGEPARTYSARGRIIDSDTNQPLPNTSIGVQFFLRQGASGAIGTVTKSNEAGEFKVENLAPGKYGVFSEPPANADWNSEAVQFEVTDQNVEGLVIKTVRGASVSGVVILEGTNDAKLRAKLLASQIVGQIMDGYTGRTDPSVTINPNGSFRITGLAPGRLTLRLRTRELFHVIRLERDGVAYPRGVEIREREQVTGLRVVVAHGSGAIRGLIRPPSGLELPSTARISVNVRRTEDPTSYLYSSPVEADARGQFRFDGLVSGTYEIFVMVFMNPTPGQPSIPPARQTVLVTNGAVVDVVITLQMPKSAPGNP